MQVSFAATHAVGHVLGSSCNANGSLRCDDPIDLSGSGGLAAPVVESTLVLNDIKVQVQTSGTWNTLRDYQLSYEQTSQATIIDPASDLHQSIAGQLDLTQLQVIGDDTSTSLPPVTFTYVSKQQFYVDSNRHPSPATNCGPSDGSMSWNVGNGSGCLLWMTTFYGNQRYLSSVNNGLGLTQSFSWDNARNNTHGVNDGNHGATANPLYCNNPPQGQGTESTYPCDEADDQNWSHIVVTQQQATTNGVTSTTGYTYFLTWPLPEQECSNCVAGMYWGNQDDGDYLDFYNGKFMGFAETDVKQPSNEVDKHHFYATMGYGVYNLNQVVCSTFTPPCVSSPWYQIGNAGHGHEFEVDTYDTDGVTQLGQVKTQYTLTCPPSGVTATPPWQKDSTHTYNWDGNRVSELDHDNPVTVCDLHPAQVDTYTLDGSGSTSTATHSTTTYSYDTYGRLTDSTSSSNSGGGATGSITSVSAHTDYLWHDAVSATSTSASGTYLIDFPAVSYTKDSGNTVHYACADTGYDGLAAGTTGSNNGLVQGLPTASDTYRTCASSGANTNPITTTYTYDLASPADATYGALLATDDPDANAGNAAHRGCTLTGSSTQHSTCLGYDGTYHVFVTSTTNALNQTATTTYSDTTTATGGFGTWPMADTDANGQTTSYAYDPLGRPTSETLPGETSGLTTSTRSYNTSTCTTTGTSVCVEIDQTQRVDSADTVTTRSFYDGFGQLVETRTPAPTAGNDLIAYATYDAAGRVTVQSEPYSIAAYTGSGFAYATPDANQPKTTYAYPSLRTTTAADPLGNQSTSIVSVECGQIGDSACYEVTTAVDPLVHQSTSYTDAWGRAIYAQRYTGNSSATYAVYATTKNTYDANGNLTQILHPDGTSKNIFTYDNASRMQSSSDPDLGSFTYTYDANGNVTQQVDARGASGTVYAAYDGLDRITTESSHSDLSGPLATWAYDNNAACTGGTNLISRLCQETFASGPGQTVNGSDTYTYDVRGRVTSSTFFIAAPNLPNGTYTTTTTYDDADRPLTESLPAAGAQPAETLTLGYNNAAGGALNSLTSSLSSPTSTIFGNVSYTSQGLVAGWQSGALSGTPSWQASGSVSYDGDLRLSDSKLVRTNVTTHDTLTVSEVQPSYDAAGNVSSVTTTLAAVGNTPGGQEAQAFCYDDLDRLTWAGTQGTGLCGRVGSEGISGAGYTASYTYDNLDRITSASVLTGSGAALAGAAQGSYSYNTANAAGHLHALSTVGSGSTGYSAAYDAAGDMTCRAVGSSTCATVGSPTGQVLGYDALRRLVSWASDGSGNPASTGQYAYDGEGSRVWQQATNTVGSTTTTTSIEYLPDGDEVVTTVVPGQITPLVTRRSYPLPTGGAAVRDASGLSFLATDQLGTPIAALTLDTGAVSGEQLRTPYGQPRYSATIQPNGASGMHTTVGFTGQHEDGAAAAPGASGLDYFNARYYDAVVGCFTSADTYVGVDPLLDAYAYVGGMVESAADPSGHTNVASAEPDAPAEGAGGPLSPGWSPAGFPDGLPSGWGRGAWIGNGPYFDPDLNNPTEFMLGNQGYSQYGDGTLLINTYGANRVVLGSHFVYTDSSSYAAAQQQYDAALAASEEDYRNAGHNGRPMNAPKAPPPGPGPTKQPDGGATKEPEPQPEPQPSTAGAGQRGGRGTFNTLGDLINALDKDRPVTVIGRDMVGRVRPFAKALDILGFKIHTWQPRGEATVKNNRSWLRYWVQAKDSQIVNIGGNAIDGMPPSRFFNMEERLTAKWGADVFWLNWP
jgi:RHS repeat-associated protein